MKYPPDIVFSLPQMSWMASEEEVRAAGWKSELQCSVQAKVRHRRQVELWRILWSQLFLVIVVALLSVGVFALMSDSKQERASGLD
jgi:hypothetical protein